mmetsp:Transcript_24855/g.71869  ORF Transcript_24855/g.71869 Transcript_24855/m.71869 type:complete len:1419 (-) Transcript_24855:699-4955(-)
MSTSQSSTCVYVRDDAHGWLPANVLSYDTAAQTAKVVVTIPSSTVGASSASSPATTTEERQIDLASYDSQTLPLQNVDENGRPIVRDDMCDLPSLHEAAILYNLRARHHRCLPYTRVGDIIIAMNPFQWLEGLYADDVREDYVDKLVWREGTAIGGGDDPRDGLAPHVYETSSSAYRGLAVDDTHQSILVTGESGAGKTETVKIIMSHLASIQTSSVDDAAAAAAPVPGAAPNTPAGEHISHHPRDNAVVRRVLDSNPLLEAFGNAKTVRNDNSSRFGKYIRLQFDVEDATQAAYQGRSVPTCLLAGSYCETYLLEKSRVVGHEAGERNYHIFYQLLAAPQDAKAAIWDGLMDDSAVFRYVDDGSGGGDAAAAAATAVTTIEGQTDGEKWQHTVEALETIGIAGDKMRTLMRSMCVVLQLGTLTFAADPDNEDGSIISSSADLTKLASLMGVNVDDITQALTFRTITAGGRGNDSYTVPLRVDAARDGCDAFAKEIYAKSFNWLVEAINSATCAEENYGHADEVDDFGIIGLLDIFGFESFKVNRFEQLCINYANEKLQQKYTLDVFSSVQEEYEYEGISLGDLEYQDNADVLGLIEGRMGVIAVLNEECVRPNGNDTSFVSKIKTINKEAAPLVDDRLHKPTEFAIQHYAGAVKYDASNFVTKNTDTLPRDLVGCATKSDNELIAGEFLNATKSKAEQEAATKPGRGRSSAVTVSTTFRSQLSSLMTNIGETKTRYVRCIKPNPQKKPLEVDLLSSTEQLRCAGVVAAVNVSRAAYPNRLMHSTALERFSCLSSVAMTGREESDSDSDGEEKKEDNSQDGADDRVAVEKLLNEVLKSMETSAEDGTATKAFAVGKSRVYFRQGALEYLEAGRLKALGVYAIRIERIVRGFLARSDFLYKKDCAIALQSAVRCHIARSQFLDMKDAATDISCWVRCVNAKVELVRLRRERASTMLQAQYRAMVARKNYEACRSSAVDIQKIARGSIQRPKYRVALKEAKEEAVVNKKIAALQKRLAEAEMKLIKANGGVVRVASKEPSAAEESKEEEVGEVAEKAKVPTDEVAEQPKSSLARAAASGIDKQLMDDSLAMIGVLKKEVFELRSKNFLLRTDMDELKVSHKNLQSQHASLSLSHDALKQNNAQTLKAKKDMLFQATREKKQAFDAKRKLMKENESLQKQVEQLQKQANEKNSAHKSELARLRAENDRLKAKEIRQNDRAAGGTLTRAAASITAPVTPPPMRRAAFNSRRGTFNADDVPPRHSARNEADDEWKLVAPKSANSGRSSEGRNPGGSKRRARGTRAGRRAKGRSSPASSEASREPCSPGSVLASPNRGGASKRRSGPSPKGMPRVTSVSSFSSETSSKSSKNKILPYKKSASNVKAPKGVETSISSSTKATKSMKRINSSLGLAAAAGAEKGRS